MYARVLYTQPSWCSFSSWLHSDITSLSRSATCTFLALPFFTAEMFLGYFIIGLPTTDKHPKSLILWHGIILPQMQTTVNVLVNHDNIYDDDDGSLHITSNE